MRLISCDLCFVHRHVEILLGTQLGKDLILKGEIHVIKEAMEKSENLGMHTSDIHLLRLYKEGIISLDEALQNSDSTNNLRLKINLSTGRGAASENNKGTFANSLSDLSLKPIEKKEHDEDLEEEH